MATTIQINESPPATRPSIDNLPDAIYGADSEAVWERIESWIAWRWGERDVEFMVEGPGDWAPPLQPFTTLTIETWFDESWVTAAVSPSPTGGYRLDLVGPFRFRGVAGSTEAPPAAVKEAYRRLLTYSSSVIGHDGGAKGAILSRESEDEKMQLAPGWASKALRYSGAADLLRRYRNLGAN